jgi:DNA-binding CsgD family transcriptional regulator
VRYTADLLNELLKLSDQITGQMQALVRASAGPGVPPPMRAWTLQYPGLAALSSLTLTSSIVGQQLMEHLHESIYPIHRALAPQAGIEAVIQPVIQVMSQPIVDWSRLTLPTPPAIAKAIVFVRQTLTTPSVITSQRATFSPHWYHHWMAPLCDVGQRLEQLVRVSEALIDLRLLSDVRDVLILMRLQAVSEAGDIPAMLEAEREAAVRRLVARLPLGLKDRAANAALRDLAREQDLPRQVLLTERLVPEGMLLAVQAMGKPRYIRLGRYWVKGPSGRKRRLTPRELRPNQLRHWLFQEVRNVAEAILLDHPYPHRAPKSTDNTPSSCDAEPGPAAWGLFLPLESRLDNHALLEHLARIAPPREREVLLLSRAGHSTAEIAATLGIQPVTVRVLRHRLKKRGTLLRSA